MCGIYVCCVCMCDVHVYGMYVCSVGDVCGMCAVCMSIGCVHVCRHIVCMCVVCMSAVCICIVCVHVCMLSVSVHVSFQVSCQLF